MNGLKKKVFRPTDHFGQKNRDNYSLTSLYKNNYVFKFVHVMLNLVFQDSDILAPSFPNTDQVAYILSLGVVVDFRKHGIGKQLKYFWKPVS